MRKILIVFTAIALIVLNGIAFDVLTDTHREAHRESGVSHN